MQRSADNRKVKPPFVLDDSALMMAAFAANKTICKSRKCCCRLCVKLKSYLRGIMWVGEGFFTALGSRDSLGGGLFEDLSQLFLTFWCSLKALRGSLEKRRFSPWPHLSPNKDGVQITWLKFAWSRRKI